MDAWRREHRGLAPEMFVGELATALTLLAANPLSGPVHRERPGDVDVRRMSLRGSRYRVYYRFLPESDRVEVLAVWHTSRGREPELR
ncbi:MAG: type II toxin-antitoxin system RelE/ParE family toxin [Deltaproteobacteria bacterium]|nr:type II toxin-antitoxin system RelE/ParE family toxin [Nannocystaceae bacterium]